MADEPKPLSPHQVLTSRSSAWILVAGVVLPALTVAVESLSRVCATALFDPMPTPLHVAAAASVPLANLVVWRDLRRGRLRAQHGLIAGWSLGVAAIYALFFLPTLPLAVPAVLLFGLGLLPLAPLLATWAGLSIRRALQRAAPAGTPLRVWPGVALALVLVAGADLPRSLTRVALASATAEDAAARRRGLWWLRSLGSERELLRFCYPRAGVTMDLLGVLWMWQTPTSPEAARGVWYRVTGRPFNDEPRPTPTMRRGFLPDWDPEQGGAVVGGRVAGLSLQSSRLDGSLDADAAVGYVEWTLELRNDSPEVQEARAQLALPRGGVVSRASLWIDGEEREAAFGARGVVRQAYQTVVRRRRDPLLVTTAGPDRILVQCYPIPPGGVMQIRVGITAPLSLPQAERGELELPHFVERNFEMPAERRHEVWLEAGSRLEAGAAGLVAERPRAGLHALRGRLEEGRAGRVVTVARDPQVRVSEAQQRLGEEELWVRQRIVTRPMPAPATVVVVVDGSAGLAPSALELSRLLARPGVELLVAGDEVEEARDAAGLASRHWRGGTDNVPALVAAWDRASARPGAVILWLHAPQPVLLQSAAPLRQRWERRPDGPRLIAFPIAPGPNRVLEQLDGVGGIESQPRRGSLAEDLGLLFERWQAGVPRLEAVRERVAERGTGRAHTTTSAHLVRLWARDEVARLAARSAREEAVALAVRHQLVTPLSGAVVLETAEQYRQAGLEPAAPQDVPTVPEPGTWALLLVASLLVASILIRRREVAPWTAA